MMSEKYSEEAHFYGLAAPFGMWAALGAVGMRGSQFDGPMAVDWGAGHKASRQEAYVIELIERARDAILAGGGELGAYGDDELLRRAIGLYGQDRMSRSLSSFASALNNLSVQVELKRLPERLDLFLGELAEKMLNKRICG